MSAPARLFAGVRATVGARPRTFLVAWIAALTLLGAGVGLLGWSVHQQERTDRAGAAVGDAGSAVVDVLSYSAATIDADLAAAGEHLTGDFADEYATLTAELIAPAARADRIDTTAVVVATSVIEAGPDEVVALMFVTQTTRSSRLPEPKIDGSRLEVTLQLVEDRWLIADLVPV